MHKPKFTGSSIFLWLIMLLVICVLFYLDYLRVEREVILLSNLVGAFSLGGTPPRSVHSVVSLLPR